MNAMIRDLGRIGRFVPVASYQRLGYFCAALLVASGLFHVLVYLVDGGPWEGPVSWRKPIVFGLSFGITLATITWVVGYLRAPKLVGWLLVGAYAVAALVEVFLISMQRWRGVPSHFNNSTPFNESVFSMMGALVSLIVLLTVVVAVWAFVRVDGPTSLSLAIRCGLVLMLVSNAVGVEMIALGGNTFGAAGALKVPHAVTLHAVQVLPALALLMLLSDFTERYRVRIVGLAALGYAALIASTMVQTYDGRAPLDLGAAATVLALAGLVLLIVCALVAVRGLAARLHPPTSPTALGT